MRVACAGNVVQSLSFSSIVPLTIWAFTFDWPLLDPAPSLGSNFLLGTGEGSFTNQSRAASRQKQCEMACELTKRAVLTEFRQKAMHLWLLCSALPAAILLMAGQRHTSYMHTVCVACASDTAVCGAAGVLLGGLLTYNSKQWLPALQ